MSQIFLCYASQDLGIVEPIYEKLSESGLKPWLDKKNIIPGEKWELSSEL